MPGAGGTVAAQDTSRRPSPRLTRPLIRVLLRAMVRPTVLSPGYSHGRLYRPEWWVSPNRVAAVGEPSPAGYFGRTHQPHTLPRPSAASPLAPPVSSR